MELGHRVTMRLAPSHIRRTDAYAEVHSSSAIPNKQKSRMQYVPISLWKHRPIGDGSAISKRPQLNHHLSGEIVTPKEASSPLLWGGIAVPLESWGNCKCM